MNIGKLSLLVILSFTFITSCSNDNDSNQTKTLNGIWNVKNISGGFAGIDDEYDTGIIRWIFDNQILTIENNESQGNIYTGFESGTYNYSTSEINGNNYITINNAEYGSFTLSANNLTINQNDTSSGAGADGFVLQFNR